MKRVPGRVPAQPAPSPSAGRRWILGALGLVLSLAALPAAPDQPRSPTPPSADELPTYSESVGSEYVLLPAIVFDRKGRFADDLQEKDFRVWVEGKSVHLDTFERDDAAPVSFAFLVDTSGSMKIADKLEMAKMAVRQIIRNRKPGDDFALFAFADEEVVPVAPFSADPAALLSGLAKLQPSGETALFDAVAATPSRLVEGKNSKRAILLFTDGVDNASRLSGLEMAEILQQISTPVYAIGIKNASFDRLSEKEKEELALDNLKILALSSGGQMFLAGGDEDLRPLAARIDAEVRKQYLLGFTPSGQGEVKYRVVVLSVTKPGSWDVRTRRGYRGTAP